MAYMKDSTGRRLDSIRSISYDEATSQFTSAVEGSLSPGPKFTRANGGNPVFSVATQNPAAGALVPTTAPTIYWPWVIDTAVAGLASPLDAFYLYYSTDHDSGAGGIWMASGPSEVGPWTGRGWVYMDATGGSSQTETPSVIPDPTGVHKLLMYYQNLSVPSAIGQQSTCVAYSDDGLTWTRVGLALDVPTYWPSDGHTGYARMSRVGGALFAASLAGGGPTPLFARWTSHDGLEWNMDTRPLHYHMDLLGDGRRIEWNSGDLFFWHGRPWWVGLASNFTSGATAKDARIITFPLSDDLRRPVGKPTVHLYPTIGSESTDYRAIQAIRARDGRLLLYYQCGLGGPFYVAEAKS